MEVAEGFDCLWIAPGLEQGLGPCERRVDPTALVSRDTVGKERRIDAETLGEPRDGLGRRACLATLDLAHVFLRETLAGEAGLRHPRSDPQLAQTLSEPKPRLDRGRTARLD